MDPIKILMDEHDVILNVITALEKYAEEGTSLDKIPKFVKFFREFLDKCHHGKEEKILFEEMEKHGFSRNHGPLSVMLYEHDEGRKLVTKLESCRKDELNEVVRDFSAVLREHIEKENNVLYPMAVSRIKDGMNDLIEKFEAFEKHQHHEELLLLSKELTCRG